MKENVKDLINPNIVKLSPEEPIKDAIIRIAASNLGPVAFVVDKTDKLLGLITPKRVLKQILVSEFGASRTPALEWVDLLNSMTSKTIGDIMGPPISVKADDMIVDVIKTMLDANLFQMPVTDQNGKLLGEVRSFTIIANWGENR